MASTKSSGSLDLDFASTFETIKKVVVETFILVLSFVRFVNLNPSFKTRVHNFDCQCCE